MSKTKASITHLGAYIPGYRLNNEELEQMVETKDNWIVERTGIKERRILKGVNKGITYMAEKAVEDLIKKNNVSIKDIDCLIFCTVTPDYLVPSSASLLSSKIGCNNILTFDINAACCGFLYGLTTAACMIESQRFKKILVIGGDKMSSMVDYEDRNTCILFGDACCACLVEGNKEGYGIIDFKHYSDSAVVEDLYHPAGGSFQPINKKTLEQKGHYLHQNGKKVFKRAVIAMSDVTLELMENNKLSGDNIDWIVPHQANKRIIDVVIERTKVKEEKVTLNIDKYGNTTCATIPLCLYEWENQFKKGDNIILTAFGGGYCWGAIYLKWSY